MEDPDAACTYCDSDVYDHDPVFVSEFDGDERVPAGRFCNYACLRAHVEREGLAVGSSCRFDP